jgi:hypothetical protein
VAIPKSAATCLGAILPKRRLTLRERTAARDDKRLLAFRIVLSWRIGGRILRQGSNIIHQRLEHKFTITRLIEHAAIHLRPFQRLNEHQRALLHAGEFIKEHSQEFADVKGGLKAVDWDFENVAAIRGR